MLTLVDHVILTITTNNLNMSDDIRIWGDHWVQSRYSQLRHSVKLLHVRSTFKIVTLDKTDNFVDILDYILNYSTLGDSMSQLPTACPQEEAYGRHFHSSYAPRSIEEVIPNKLPLDGARLHAKFLTKIGWCPLWCHFKDIMSHVSVPTLMNFVTQNMIAKFLALAVWWG